MATFNKLVLGASTNGRAVSVAATSSPGTTVHTGSTTTTDIDEVWLYAQNVTTTQSKLTVEWGATGSSDSIEVTIPAESGLVLVAPGLLIKGAATALIIRAFSDAGGSINVFGYVNRIS